MKKISICLSIFLALAISRFVPHPPNFTSLIALSFYVPLIFGLFYLPIVIISFALTDLFFGFHQTLFFTWGSILLIGLISKYFFNSLIKRLAGALTGAVIFYLITNFGVWLTGSYPLGLEGLIMSYFAGLPFFAYTLISTIVFSAIIEALYKFYKFNFKRV